MPQSSQDSEQEFARLAEAMSQDPRVDPPDVAPAKGFGSKGLKVARKLFAFLDSKERLVVKLPADRVDALVSEGKGTRFDPGHGRLMKEWVAFGLASIGLWSRFAREALEYAAGKAARPHATEERRKRSSRSRRSSSPRR